MEDQGQRDATPRAWKLPYRGGAITLLLLLLLATPPTEIVEQAGAYADTRGDIRSAEATSVRVHAGLTGDPAKAIPRELGNWTGVDDTTWPDLLRDTLAYDALLVRHYGRPGIFQSVELMVLSARHADAFHNPTVCFRANGGSVMLLEDTHIDLDGGQHAVGRMVVEGKDDRPRVVYNLYLVEEKFSAPSRTTWIRLNVYGANATHEAELEPFLLDLLNQVAPHAFSSRAGARTTMEAIASAGTPWAVAAVAVAVAPVSAELVMRRRR